MSLAYSIGAETISIYINGDLFQLDKTHAHYSAVLEELRKPEKDEGLIAELANFTSFVAKLTAGRVQVGDNAILFKGQPVGGYMVDRLLDMVHKGDPVDSWAMFMDNLMDNPLPTVRDDLYKWMEAGKMPITPDGCIIAFKKVRGDYTDVHTGKFSNAVGAVLEMDRALCDTNRNNTCSTGFHFCSAGYLSHFSGQKVMVVKINPRDVTAIPKDYHNQKARCCRYTVTGELTSESAARHNVWATNVVNLEDPSELPQVMLPRGNPPSKLAHDPARVDGPPPVDDLATKSSAPAPVAAEPPKKKARPNKAKAPAAAPAAKAEVPAAKKKARSKKVKAPAEKPAPKKAAKVEPVAQPEPPQNAPQEPVFESKAGKFTASEITRRYDAVGRNRAKLSAETGVPKTTLLGWLKKLGL